MKIQSFSPAYTPAQKTLEGAANQQSPAPADGFQSLQNEDPGLIPPPDNKGPEKPSMASYIGKGAFYGAVLGFVAPAITIIGLAATPITVPLGAVLGAFAGASAYTHPDYKPE